MFCNREATGNHMQKRISVWFMAVTYMLCFLFSVGCDKDGNAEKEMRYTDIVLAQNGGSDYAVVLQDGAEPLAQCAPGGGVRRYFDPHESVPCRNSVVKAGS